MNDPLIHRWKGSEIETPPTTLVLTPPCTPVNPSYLDVAVTWQGLLALMAYVMFAASEYKRGISGV